MQLPVEFEHTVESGVIARTKQYVIKASKFVVDVLEDAEAFVELGYRVLREGVDEVKTEKEKVAKEKAAK